MVDNRKTINLKLDAETKSKIETLAYLDSVSLQDLILQLINKEIDKNVDIIAEAEKLKEKKKLEKE